MPSFRMRRNKLRGSDSARLRGGTTVTPADVNPGTAVRGLTPSWATQPVTKIHAAIPHVPVVTAGRGVTPTVRPAILKRDPQRVVSGSTPKPRAATGRAASPRGTVGSPKLPTVVHSPAIQETDDVTGVTPDTGTPTATGSPKVPGKATGTPAVPKPRIVPKRK